MNVATVYSSIGHSGSAGGTYTNSGTATTTNKNSQNGSGRGNGGTTGLFDSSLDLSSVSLGLLPTGIAEAGAAQAADSLLAGGSFAAANDSPRASTGFTATMTFGIVAAGQLTVGQHNGQWLAGAFLGAGEGFSFSLTGDRGDPGPEGQFGTITASGKIGVSSGVELTATRKIGEAGDAEVTFTSGHTTITISSDNPKPTSGWTYGESIFAGSGITRIFDPPPPPKAKPSFKP
jgi:hypothetical protein